MTIVSLQQVILYRPGVGPLSRGPVLAAHNDRAVAAILGPLEVYPDDRVVLAAKGRLPGMWELETGFTLRAGVVGSSPQCALIYLPLDGVICSVDESLKRFSNQRIAYQAGASDPTVRIVLV